MSAAKHTPGPWAVDENGAVYQVVGHRRTYIKLASVWREEAWYGDDGDDESRANARRIVACVNACEGLTTEALERLGTLDRARVQLDVVRAAAIQQRDELLAALQAVLRWIDDYCETTGFDAVEAQADAAIARATGAGS